MESLANQYNIDGTVNPLVIGICILLILLGIVKLADYLDDRKQTQCDDLMSGHVVYELNPTKKTIDDHRKPQTVQTDARQVPKCSTRKAESL